ncbi:hypothetical protein BJY01DRAFT_57883 [Aspergillus pseudoustus]|uniref:Uncharacterized protein n=1 Tax=Aspergillus pseudoustus TaxID=1810923 RepID=A0ABR4KNG4_9EURO
MTSLQNGYKVAIVHKRPSLMPLFIHSGLERGENKLSQDPCPLNLDACGTSLRVFVPLDISASRRGDAETVPAQMIAAMSAHHRKSPTINLWLFRSEHAMVGFLSSSRSSFIGFSVGLRLSGLWYPAAWGSRGRSMKSVAEPRDHFVTSLSCNSLENRHSLTLLHAVFLFFDAIRSLHSF